MAKQGDSLFLLEVLVDKIIVTKTPCFTDRDFRTCVNIQCPSMDPLEICDDEPSNIAKGTSPFIKSFNSGKSCLFSLKESDISSAMSKFPVKVSVYKALPCGCLPTKIIIGECTIDMTKEFVEARNKYLENPTNVSYQALKDSFHLVGPDSNETGEIVMFLRISCFGKLIVTRFQGTGPPNMLSGAGSSSVVDRSCIPKKDFQTVDDPCACGAARGQSGAPGGKYSSTTANHDVCPSAQDPYNSMPCENQDDPCYCSGVQSQNKDQLVCRNTDQYCLHVPKGNEAHSTYYQETIEQKYKLKNAIQGLRSSMRSEKKSSLLNLYFPTRNDNLESSISCLSLENDSEQEVLSKHSRAKLNLYNTKETMVYMTFLENYSRRRSSATQATASINKCFQVYKNSNPNTFATNSNYCSTCTMYQNSIPYITDKSHCSQVYFFGRKRNNEKGMGKKSSRTSLHKTDQTTAAATKSSSKTSVKQTSTTNIRTERKPAGKKGIAAGTCTSKSVSIRDEKSLKPCPTIGTTKGDMIATVSHIQIGPKEVCPLHGPSEQCIGPKCIAAQAQSDKEHPQVKVTTVNNPRRGVFELVIRKLTGAPLAKNELMLEWSPPPSQPPPCPNACPMSCPPPKICRPPKCKMIKCQPPACKPKCCKKVPCYVPPTPTLCKKCCKPSCRKTSMIYCLPPNPSLPPCSSPSTCPALPPCKVFPPCKTPTPCGGPCPPILCQPPNCRSSPCIKVCPVGRYRRRKTKSQPKIKAYRKRNSPCHNRSKTCPMVQCRSASGSCIGCCGHPPPPCPKKCCSGSACKPVCCSNPCKVSCNDPCNPCVSHCGLCCP